MKRSKNPYPKTNEDGRSGLDSCNGKALGH